jgi:hypothetical protein
MANNIFYVKAVDGTYVAATFLQYNGQYILDPNASVPGVNASNRPLYADLQGTTLLPSNTGGYLIVPADCSIDRAVSFAKSVQSLINESGTNGVDTLSAAMDLMANAFLPNGSQDLQRTYNGGSSQSAVPAFTSAASFNL